MANALLRRLVRTLLAASSLTLALCGPARAEGETAPLPDPAVDAPFAKAAGRQTAVFAAGCFLGIEAVFRKVALRLGRELGLARPVH